MASVKRRTSDGYGKVGCATWNDERVRSWPRDRREIWYYLLTGSSEAGKLFWHRTGKSKKYKDQVGIEGTDTAKDLIFFRFKIDRSGAGYMNLLQWADEEYLAQLTSEKAVRRRVNGRTVRRYVPTRDRNEALDLEVYNLAALN